MTNVRIKTTRFKVQMLGREDGRALVDGHAAVFNNVDEEDEVILPGAFAKFLATGSQLPMYFTHAWALDNPAKLPIGVTAALKEDNEGLYFQAVLGNTTEGRDVAELMAIKAVEGASFGFDVLPGGAEKRNGITYLKALWPVEISVAAMFAANPKASARLLAVSDTNDRPAPAVSAEELFAAVLRGLNQTLNEA